MSSTGNRCLDSNTTPTPPNSEHLQHAKLCAIMSMQRRHQLRTTPRTTRSTTQRLSRISPTSSLTTGPLNYGPTITSARSGYTTMMLTGSVFPETLECKSMLRQIFSFSDPGTASENTCGDSLKRSVCRTSSTIQTYAAPSLRSQVLRQQSMINKPACGRTTRDHQGRLVEARGGPAAVHHATATSMNTMMMTKSPCSSSRSAPAK